MSCTAADNKGSLFARVMLPILCALALGACSQYAEIPPTPDELRSRDSVLAFLETVDESGLQTAFVNLGERTFTETIITRQFDAAGKVLAVDKRLIRNMLNANAAADENPDPRDDRFLLTSESVSGSGTFDLGAAAGLVPMIEDAIDASDLGGYPIPDDRGYNNPRHQSKYRFEFLADSVISGRSLRTVAIDVRDDASSFVPVQSIRIFVDRELLQVVALRLRLRSDGLLFKEASTIFMEGREARDGTVLPLRTEFASSIEAFFSDPIRLETASTFSGLDS